MNNFLQSLFLRNRENEFDQPIGLLYRMEEGEPIVYIGRGYGINQEDDERHILNNGFRIEFKIFKRLVDMIEAHIEELNKS